MNQESNVRNGWMLHPQIGFQTDESMIDVGSGFGSYTLTALALGAKHVWAFDKNKELVHCLRENLRINGDKYRIRCSVINKTVSPLGINLDDFVFNQLSSPPQKLRWIKVDVGGQDELNIIQGALKIVQTYHPMRIMVHHYDGIDGYDRFVQTFLTSNSLDMYLVYRYPLWGADQKNRARYSLQRS